MDTSLMGAGLCLTAYAARCLIVWIRTRRDIHTVRVQHSAGARMVESLPGGSRVALRSAAGDEVTIEVGAQPSSRTAESHGG